MSNTLILTRRLLGTSDKNVLILPLTAEERTRLRGKRVTSCGCDVLLQLPREGFLRPGDILVGEDRRINVLVEAAVENLMIVRAESSLDLLKASYHLGNRHVNLELHDDELFLLEDNVVCEMLVRMGLNVDRLARSFYPEVGAYNELHSHATNL